MVMKDCPQSLLIANQSRRIPNHIFFPLLYLSLSSLNYTSRSYLFFLRFIGFFPPTDICAFNRNCVSEVCIVFKTMSHAFISTLHFEHLICSYHVFLCSKLDMNYMNTVAIIYLANLYCVNH